MLASYRKSRPATFLLVLFFTVVTNALAQTGNATSITGVAPKAAVRLVNATFVLVFILRTKSAPAQQRFVAFALSVRPPPCV